MSKEYGYHKRLIKKGVLGEVSKIKEELDELEDSLDQENPIMALVEVSDMVGALKSFLKKHHPEVSLTNLLQNSSPSSLTIKESIEGLTKGNIHHSAQQLIDSIHHFLVDTHPSITLKHLVAMQEATERAFVHGHRK